MSSQMAVAPEQAQMDPYEVGHDARMHRPQCAAVACPALKLCTRGLDQGQPFHQGYAYGNPCIRGMQMAVVRASRSDTGTCHCSIQSAGIFGDVGERCSDHRVSFGCGPCNIPCAWRKIAQTTFCCQPGLYWVLVTHGTWIGSLHRVSACKVKGHFRLAYATYMGVVRAVTCYLDPTICDTWQSWMIQCRKWGFLHVDTFH